MFNHICAYLGRFDGTVIGDAESDFFSAVELETGIIIDVSPQAPCLKLDATIII